MDNNVSGSVTVMVIYYTVMDCGSSGFEKLLPISALLACSFLEGFFPGNMTGKLKKSLLASVISHESVNSVIVFNTE